MFRKSAGAESHSGSSEGEEERCTEAAPLATIAILTAFAAIAAPPAGRRNQRLPGQATPDNLRLLAEQGFDVTEGLNLNAARSMWWA